MHTHTHMYMHVRTCAPTQHTQPVPTCTSARRRCCDLFEVPLLQSMFFGSWQTHTHHLHDDRTHCRRARHNFCTAAGRHGSKSSNSGHGGQCGESCYCRWRRHCSASCPHHGAHAQGHHKSTSRHMHLSVKLVLAYNISTPRQQKEVKSRTGFATDIFKTTKSNPGSSQNSFWDCYGSFDEHLIDFAIFCDLIDLIDLLKSSNRFFQNSEN